MTAGEFVDWRALRGLRADPPHLAARFRDRRQTFTAALEQAEQFLRAASGAGYATKAVQLFYALSQSGRAICAAHLPTDWQIVGHGATVMTQEAVGASTVEPHKNGALPMVAKATGSEIWEGPVALGALWSSLPELQTTCLDPGQHQPLVLCRDPNVAAQTYPAQLHEIYWNRGGILFEGHDEDPAALDRRLEEILAPYPRAASGWRTAGITPTGVSTRIVWLLWSHLEQGQEVITPIESLTEPSGDGVCLRPGLSANDAIPSRLITWWGILLALSSLARYEPVGWRKALDIDQSPIADSLERALDLGVEKLPALVLDALLRDPVD